MTARIVVLALIIATAADAGPPASGPSTPAPESAVIELVTMGIGSLIWERHGHIALCVTERGLKDALRHPGNPKNACYNYGIGNFHEPFKMAWGFFRGTTSFWVGRDTPERMLEVYLYYDRTVWVQPLPLDADQKRRVIEKLERDILPENRNYAYDHFIDNCTTRIRDIIDGAMGGALRTMADPATDSRRIVAGPSGTASSQAADTRTFRDHAREGFAGMPSLARPSLLVTDIAMGRSTDRIPTYWERMFLPQYLREAVANRLGIAPEPIYTRKECRGVATSDCIDRGTTVPGDGPSGRVLFALLALLLTAPAWATRLWGSFQRTGLAVAVVPYVLLGTVLTALAVVSPLPYVRWNETCLVFFPLDVAVLLLSPARARRYARARVMMLAVIAALLLVDVLHQPLWAPMLWPLIPMLAVGFIPARKRPAAGAG